MPFRLLKSYMLFFVGLWCFGMTDVQKACAQNRLNTPLEILTYMQASGTKYEVEPLTKNFPKRERIVLPHGAYIETVEGREHTLEYQHGLACAEEKDWKKARELVSVEKPDYKKARQHYQKVLKTSPKNAQIYTQMGETYFEQGDYSAARTWLQQAIQLNSIDYLARWMMAEIYVKEAHLDSAVQAITIAHLYNRSNPRLLLRLREIYEQNGRSYWQNWGFEPLYINYKEDSTVVISADGIWLTYAMYKAVWNYEPGYVYIKSKQEVTDYLFHQEMEAVVGTYMTYSMLAEADKRFYPSIRALEKALDENMLEEYVFYEILLVERPTLANYITPVFLERMLNYIHTIRSVDYTAK